MSQSQLKYSVTVLIILCCFIVVQSNDNGGKSSLTFVIDDTASMSDDIDQVIEASNKIFDTVTNSKKSPIDNFVLVTFNDPTTEVRKITKDRAEFKNALTSIRVHGGGDCEEFSMTGIQRALENSHIGSYLYVFTDATAKDYNITENVKNLAVEMRSQVVFVLTGMCGKTEDAPDYQVYQQLATATSGEIFHLEKQDDKVILDYVRATIEAPTTLIVSKIFPPGYGNKFNYTIDSKTKDPLISVTGTEPKVDVTGPDGSKPHSELIDLDNIAILKVKDAKPGTHTVEVGSKSKTTVKVVARSEIQFKFGFSNFIPSSFDDVTSRPVPEKKCFIAVELTEGDIKLQTLRILDMENVKINEIPLTVVYVNGKEKIYATEMIMVPATMFRIAIVGFDPETNSNITRIASSPVEPQRITEKIMNKSPTVIIGKEKVTFDYEGSLKLTCKINGYPKPDVIWIENKADTTRNIAVNVSDFKLPYDFISVLELEHVKENATYQCKAKNELGSDAKEILLETNTFFQVLEKPKDIKIQYNKEGKVYCKINSNPKANITWSKNGITDTLTGNPNISIITNESSSVLIIKSMGIQDIGTYICEARNGIERRLLKAQIEVEGFEPPVIDKDVIELFVKLHEDTYVNCSLQKGVPKPTIHWYYKKDFSSESIEMPEWLNRREVYLRHAQKNDQGVYSCLAENELGQDYKEVDVFIEYPPSIKEDRKYIQVNEKQDVFLPCSVEGNPIPYVEWYKNDTLYTMKDEDYLFENKTLRINSVTIGDKANYICLASNHLGVANKTIFVNVHVPVHITTPRDKMFNVKVGSRFALQCQAQGIPTPRLVWKHRRLNNIEEVSLSTKTRVAHESTLLFEHIQLKDDGFYECIAWNSPTFSDVALYHVRVYAPPVIENMYREKLFQPIEGDLALRINCSASGNPKPEINWIKDGYYVALGDSFNIENGTLVIKNIDKDVSGTYVCEAKNNLGRDTEAYEVEVLSAPPVNEISRTILVPYGGTKNIDCNIPHKLTDRLKWFKDRRFLKTGELTINNAKLSDIGYYSCRVNGFVKSSTENVKIKVGFKPVFKTEEPEHIEMLSGNPIFLNCEAEGVPVPKVHWWHNEVQINSSEFIHTTEPTIDNQGLYYCNIRNDFGAIARRFNVHLRDCVINLNKRTSKQPLMLTSSLSWPNFHTNDKGFMIIPRDEYINLFCPSRFTKFSYPYTTAFCDGGSKFKINGISTEYSNLQCTEKFHHIVQETGEKCLNTNPNAEKIKISFKVLRKPVDVYEVCFDKINKSPVYAKVNMAKHSIGTIEEPKWSDEKYFDIDIDEMYDCKRQSTIMTFILNKWSHKDDGCCFRKRKLVHENDVSPGVAQEAVASYFNIVPQWGTCNSENWDDLERSVRVLSKLSYSDILVWTGVSEDLHLPTAYGKKGRIRIVDKKGHQQPVPKYLWKVIQNPATSSSVAVIQMNIPDLNPSDVPRHVLCPDICNQIKWMNGTKWNNVDKGYIYCCSLDEFEKSFNFNAIFEPHYSVLSNVESAPVY